MVCDRDFFLGTRLRRAWLSPHARRAQRHRASRSVALAASLASFADQRKPVTTAATAPTLVILRQHRRGNGKVSLTPRASRSTVLTRIQATVKAPTPVPNLVKGEQVGDCYLSIRAAHYQDAARTSSFLWIVCVTAVQRPGNGDMNITGPSARADGDASGHYDSTRSARSA
jgi:hypothetical protein